MSNTKIAQKPRFSVMLQTDKYQQLINDTLQDPKRRQRFIASITSAVSANPDLHDCEAGSIISCALQGEALELSPSPQLGHFYMVPFENKKRNIKVATFILGYKGYIQLAIRSGQYRHITVSAIKKGELKSFNPITEEIDVQHIEDETARAAAETIGYYAMFELVNGFQKGIYWSKKKMLSHAAQYSAAFGPAPARGRFPGRVSYTDYLAGKYNKDDEWAYSSYWYKDFDGMAYKTMLRQLISKWGVMSIEMRTAFENDGAAINADGSANYFAEDEVTPDYEDDANIPEDAAPDVDDSTGEVLEGQVIIGVDDL